MMFAGVLFVERRVCQVFLSFFPPSLNLVSLHTGGLVSYARRHLQSEVQDIRSTSKNIVDYVPLRPAPRPSDQDIICPGDHLGKKALRFWVLERGLEADGQKNKSWGC